jgi:pimeloyl-ACP methyl ester carboxylesterase
MVWWEDGFCEQLAASGRYVIRFDNRDTGRSVSYEVGKPGYDASDLIEDAIGVLDAFGIDKAHIVGVSAGGGNAQLLALDHPDRLRSLTLISTTFAVSGGGDLPGPTAELHAFFGVTPPDWDDQDAVVDYLVAYSEVLAGTRRPFPEQQVRKMIETDVRRADNIATIQNHDILSDPPRSRPSLASIEAPTLVVHGSADPMFPLPHGQALADAIPNAEFLVLADAGHGVERADWPTLVEAINKHTAG